MPEHGVLLVDIEERAVLPEESVFPVQLLHRAWVRACGERACAFEDDLQDLQDQSVRGLRDNSGDGVGDRAAGGVGFLLRAGGAAVGAALVCGGGTDNGAAGAVVQALQEAERGGGGLQHRELPAGHDVPAGADQRGGGRGADRDGGDERGVHRDQRRELGGDLDHDGPRGRGAGLREAGRQE